MPRKSTYSGYSDKEKIAYYKAKAEQAMKSKKKTPKKTSSRKASNMSTGELITEGASRLGKLALTAIPKMLTGFGDYAAPAFKPRQNSIMSEMLSNGPPSMHSTNARSFIFRHREYLGDVQTGSAGAFNINNYYINPGLPSSFPWLSQIASNFEQYRFNGLVYEFKSTSADALNSTNTALGVVIMVTDYNAGDDNFGNKQEMENHEFASSARQSCSMLHPIECKKSQTPVSELYIRNGPVPSGEDPRLYDLGNFQIATQGQQGSSVNIGELWVTYEVEFFKPQLGGLTTGSSLLTDHFWSSTGVSTSAYFGTSRTTREGSSLGCTVSGNTITFPSYITQGNYIGTIFWAGANTAVTTPSFAYTSNCQGIAIWQNDLSDKFVGPSAAGTSTNLVTAFTCKITGPNAVITISGGTLPGSITSMDLFINAFDSDIST